MTTEQINRPCPIRNYRPFLSPGQSVFNLDKHDPLIIDPDAVREQIANILFTINTLLEVASITSVRVPVKTRLRVDTTHRTREYWKRNLVNSSSSAYVSNHLSCSHEMGWIEITVHVELTSASDIQRQPSLLSSTTHHSSTHERALTLRAAPSPHHTRISACCAPNNCTRLLYKSNT